MIDLRRLRNEPDVVLAALGRRGIDLAPLHQVIELDQRQRDLARQRDDLRDRKSTRLNSSHG